MNKVVHIEICKSYRENRFNLRIGDIWGCCESQGFSKEDILSEISDEIDNLSPNKSEGIETADNGRNLLKIPVQTGSDNNLAKGEVEK